MYRALFQIAKLTDVALGSLLDALTNINCEQLSAFPNIPLIYKSGVRYHHEDEDDPWLCTLSVLAEHRRALAEGEKAIIDCEDLSCWRAAELRVRFGVRTATPIFRRRIVKINGVQKEMVHILVGGLPGGQTEDPSVILGMRPRANYL